MLHLRILSSVLLIEMFDLPGKELKCLKELLLNHYKYGSLLLYSNSLRLYRRYCFAHGVCQKIVRQWVPSQ